MAARPRKPPIPLTVVAGPFGAGKTTLINRALKHPAFANTAVILNEFGAVALENALVERAEDGIVALGGGCVCCAVRGELVDALENLLRGLDNGRIAALGRVMIEANADADPSAILAGIGMHPYLPMRFSFRTASWRWSRPTTWRRSTRRRRGNWRWRTSLRCRRRKSGLDGGCRGPRTSQPDRQRIVDAASAAPAVLAGHGPFDPATTDIAHWLGPENAAGGAHALNVFTVARQRPIPLAALDRFLDHLAALQGPNLIRVRGLVAVEGGESAVVEGIGAFFLAAASRSLAAGRAGDPLLGAAAGGLDRQGFEAYLDAFLNEARIDTPDRTAMTDNPLRVTGFSARPGR